MGDPAGIGPEISIKTLASPQLSGVDMRLLGQASILRRCADALGLAPPGGAQLVDIPVEGMDEVQPGEISAAGGRAAEASIIKACDMAKAGDIDAIVTGPINKESLRAAGCPHIGHTEMLAEAFGVDKPLTLFVTDRLRVFFLSRHKSLRDAIDYATRGNVLDMLRRVHEAMGQLGHRNPSIAVAAMNPHSSDGGQFGTEEDEHLEPAVADAQAEGIDARGPIGADSVFHQGLEGAHDCVLSLYHDQGHIATKTRDFYGTISATLGLPVLRTSVDHGTAFDIAWQGKANEYSLVRAVEVALELLEAGA
jgi:4-hydroxythreonine-4-phosphate dehydrogenase